MFLSVSHKKPKSHSRAISKGILLLISTIALTYYAKSHTPTLDVVRQHGLLGWSFPSHNGLVSLIVLPDDGNDDNLERNGERIWVGLPDHPSELEKSFVRFAGPRMTILQDSPDLSAIMQASASVDSGGTLLLVGENLPPQDTLQENIPHLNIIQRPSSAIPHLALSDHAKATWNGQTLLLEHLGFALCYSKTTCPQQKWSLQIYSQKSLNPSKGPRIESGSDKPTTTELFLAPEAYAAAFYQEGRELRLRKVKLQEWTIQ